LNYACTQNGSSGESMGRIGGSYRLRWQQGTAASGPVPAAPAVAALDPGQIERGTVLAVVQDAARRFAVACGHPRPRLRAAPRE
jgi:hypothetical protein